MSTIAIITARGGSKRIPRKNIKEFMGKPMLAYAIESALSSGIFDEVMVSTDDEEIAAIARRYGANVPFLRSEKTANDFATTYDVLEEVVLEYRKQGVEYDNLCCIYPCVPFLTGEILRNACHAKKEKGAAALMPVVRYSFPIQRAVRVNEEGWLEYREPINASKRSQDLEPSYHDVGMFYMVDTQVLLETKTLVPAHTVLFEMDECCVQDIDTDEDWKLAELKYKVQHVE